MGSETASYIYTLGQLLPQFQENLPEMIRSCGDSLLMAYSWARNQDHDTLAQFTFGRKDRAILTEVQQTLWIIGEIHGIEAIATLWSNRNSPQLKEKARQLIHDWNEVDIREVAEYVLPDSIKRVQNRVTVLEKQIVPDGEIGPSEKITQAKIHLEELKKVKGKFIAQLPTSEITRT